MLIPENMFGDKLVKKRTNPFSHIVAIVSTYYKIFPVELINKYTMTEIIDAYINVIYNNEINKESVKNDS